MAKAFKYYHDAGHGWVAVKRKLLKFLGIHDRISHYSYQRGATVYLEEDSDATIFFNALVEQGYFSDHVLIPLDHRYSEKTSPIRSYESYKE